MGLGSFFQSASRLLRTLARPDWKTYWLSIKIVFVGVAIIGAIGYFVKAIALMFTPLS
ncbi:preprotein translocase subunit SecE [Candidatus Bathyarchaeota archaeon]|jgi:preprotein translocase subunit Sss1|nr:preprotein translocase subunit SecE [Candidatus Bathyarchaeota archaeon]MBL7167833.1 preprotein translocase subunit SecE [Candidatus Bathyarchaeota archaeon]